MKRGRGVLLLAGVGGWILLVLLSVAVSAVLALMVYLLDEQIAERTPWVIGLTCAVVLLAVGTTCEVRLLRRKWPR
jgi:uncharacterized membrane protein YsdA (DUF1294 family)